MISTNIKVIERSQDKYEVVIYMMEKEYYSFSEFSYEKVEKKIPHWRFDGYEKEDIYFTTEQKAIDFAHKLTEGKLTLKYPRTVLELNCNIKNGVAK